LVHVVIHTVCSFFSWKSCFSDLALAVETFYSSHGLTGFIVQFYATSPSFQMKSLTRFAFSVAALISAAPSWAFSTILDFDTLPSEQGWSYGNSGSVSETAVFSVGSDTLFQNSTGLGFSNNRLVPGSAPRYVFPGIVDPLLPFTVEVRARVLNAEGDLSHPFGFLFAVATGVEIYGIAIGTDRIEDWFSNVLSSSINTSQFHDYVLRGIPGVGYDFYVDNALLASGPPHPDSRNWLFLGDGTNRHNAQGEITSYRFTQQSVSDLESVPVPLPIFGIGAGFCMSRKLRRRVKGPQAELDS
jgi:hypothetical protein